MKNNYDELYKEMEKKLFISRGSNAEVIYVRGSIYDLTEDQLSDKSKAYFDGMFIRDLKGNFEDDIQQVNAITKDGKVVNLEEYYAENGCFGGEETYGQFLEAIKNLKDK